MVCAVCGQHRARIDASQGSRDDSSFERGREMDLGLSGRVAIVAAASQGLGRAVAEELAREGAQVAICARTAGRLEETAAYIQKATGREVLHRALDVTDAEAVASFVQAAEARFG